MYALYRGTDAFDMASGSAGGVSLTPPTSGTYVFRDRKIDHVEPRMSPVATLPTAGVGTRRRAFEDLRRLRRLTPNANIISFDLAERFVALIPKTGEFPYSFSVQRFGTTAVLDLVSSAVEAQLEFLPDGTIAANIDSHGEEWDADIPGFDGKAIPLNIAQKLEIRVR